jgi:hypothetical protein
MGSRFQDSGTGSFCLEDEYQLYDQNAVYCSMSSEKVMKLFQSLPDEFQREVLDFIELLMAKLQKAEKKDSKTDPPSETASLFGHAKGKVYVAPDFDEPLEDFKEYM